jgi:NitT/TauT family transport system permease protein/taurine transport system permease protein
MRMRGRGLAITQSAFPFLVLVALWWALTHTYAVPRALFPRPDEVWAALMENLRSGVLAEYMGVSLRRLLIGFGIGSALGVVLGFLFGLLPGVGRFFRPLVQFLNSISGITWLPLVIIWLGLGEQVIAFVIVNAVIFVVLLNTMTGVQVVPKVYEQALYTLGGTRWHVIRDVLIPGALPHILTGLRLALGMAWRALIAGEIVASSSGLGYQIYIGSSYFKQDVVVMGIIVVGILATMLDRILFEPLEDRTIRRWGLVVERQV